MSNDFLRSYTIPTLQNCDANAEKNLDTNTPAEELGIISNCSRYVPAGKQVDEDFIAKANTAFKRAYSAISKKICNGEADFKQANFIGRDPSYPKELNELIKPLFCELCNVQLNSGKTANCHYESKHHNRKITAWLAEKYPENPPKVKRLAKDGPTGPEALHCSICDLPLTSISHAKQHYSGRKHWAALTQKSDPSGAGFYNADGKWVRTGTKKFGGQISDRRFGIGLDFVPKLNENVESSAAVVGPKLAEHVDESLFCKICNIFVTSSVQMNMHVSGSKHKKKAATKDIAEVQASPDNIEMNLNSGLDSAIGAFKDYSNYRTPTGFYYCPICNININHVTVLEQHIQGKKHRMKTKLNQSKPVNSPAQK